jgi:hypothetical protein
MGKMVLIKYVDIEIQFSTEVAPAHVTFVTRVLVLPLPE